MAINTFLAISKLAMLATPGTAVLLFTLDWINNGVELINGLWSLIKRMYG